MSKKEVWGSDVRSNIQFPARGNPSILQKTLSKFSSCFCIKMPKFTKNCNNSFHDEWSDGVDGSRRIVNLRAFGLDGLAEAFFKFSAHEKNITSKKVTHIWKSCVQQCLKKRNFTRHLSKLSPDTIEKKVSKNLIGRNMYIFYLP